MDDPDKINKKPWGSKEKLDAVDILWTIAEKYTKEEFERLDFDSMLREFFSNAGTSSTMLFDIYLKAGEKDYLDKTEDKELIFHKKLEKELESAALEAKIRGVRAQILSIREGSSLAYKSAPMPPLEESSSESEEAWTLHLAPFLIVKAWQLIAEHDREDRAGRKFIDSMYQAFTINDRQHGYNGKRGSIVNECILAAGSENKKISGYAKRALALLSLIRRINQDVTKRDEFWPYFADAKSLGIKVEDINVP